MKKKDLLFISTLFVMMFIIIFPLPYFNTWNDKILCNLFHDEDVICPNFASEKIFIFLVLWCGILILFRRNILKIFFLTIFLYFLLFNLSYHLYSFLLFGDFYYCKIDMPFPVLNFNFLLCH